MRYGRRNPASDELRSAAKVQRSNPTRAEELVRECVRGGRPNGHRFGRRVPTAPDVADVLCTPARSIVELDGPPHDGGRRKAHGLRRDVFLREQGLRVLRFTDDAFPGNPDKTMKTVVAAGHPTLPPLRGRVARACEPGEGRP